MGMFGKIQKIYTAETGSINDMARSILRLLCLQSPVLKIVFFHSPANSIEYKHNMDKLHKTVAVFFGCNIPMVSYIAQRPSSGGLTAEVTYLDDNTPTLEYHKSHIVLNDGVRKELITGGIISDDIDQPAFEQANDIFLKISQILSDTGMAISDIYRQWNYIPQITSMNNGIQNYQEFNDARSIFYSGTEWSNGYPAATGIGTCCGGVMIELLAATGGDTANHPIDNPMQIAAHSYSQNVLAGNAAKQLKQKTTPKFERARIMQNRIYISGTAAIKGEASTSENNAVKQTADTMSIMDILVAPKNIPVQCKESRYSLLRVYVKRKDDIPAVKEYMDTHYPAPQKHYLLSDVCRPELLVEIEGIATVQ